MELKIDLTSFSGQEHCLNQEHVYDVIIVGGGPAALNASLYCARKNLDTGIITSKIGGQISESASIENWLGIPFIESNSLVNQFFKHVQEYRIFINQNSEVDRLDLDQTIKKLYSKDRVYQAKSIIIATGSRHRLLGIPGEKEFIGRGVAFCTTCDAPVFQNKKVVVVGGGNSAVVSAIDMAGYASEVILVHRKDKLSADPILTDKLFSNSKISVLYNTVCKKIKGSDHVEFVSLFDLKTNQITDIQMDGFFVEIGFIPASNFVPNILKNERNEIIINKCCETSLSGVFAAGDVTDVPFKQVIIAAGEGAKAALTVTQYIMNN
ncbi:MAG: NAD(P)/FAD-dependent oxidoreductase [Brevinema sp.]